MIASAADLAELLLLPFTFYAFSPKGHTRLRTLRVDSRLMICRCGDCAQPLTHHLFLNVTLQPMSKPATHVDRRRQLMIKQSDAKGMEKVDDAMLMTQIEATMLRTKVLELIASRATINKVPMKEVE